jgi:hypothetical protein
MAWGSRFLQRAGPPDEGPARVPQTWTETRTPVPGTPAFYTGVAGYLSRPSTSLCVEEIEVVFSLMVTGKDVVIPAVIYTIVSLVPYFSIPCGNPNLSRWGDTARKVER